MPGLRVATLYYEVLPSVTFPLILLAGGLYRRGRTSREEDKICEKGRDASFLTIRRSIILSSLRSTNGLLCLSYKEVVTMDL